MSGPGADARRSSQVLAALNHAEYTFRSFTAEDWRDMAKECARQADARTCVDCGRDVLSALYVVEMQPEKQHRRRGDRWACR